MSTTLARVLGSFVALGVVVGLIAAGHPEVTKARLEKSLTPTFTDLYLQQAVILGRTSVTAASMQAVSVCDRGGPKVKDVGPGSDWICYIDWNDVAGKRLHGKFELQAKSNACYVATGPSRLNGPVMITDTHGRDVLNPVFEFDACYDPAG